MGSARGSVRREEEHEIRLPSKLLDQIQQKEDKGEYEEDNSRFTKFDRPKTKGKQLSRKEKRQQDREAKKQKRIKSIDSRKPKEPTKSAQKTDKKISKEDPIAQLAALKANKKSEKTASLGNKRKAGNDQEDPLEQLAALKAKKAKNDPLAQLAALKAKKASKTEKSSMGDDPLAQLAALKANKNGKSSEIRIVKEDDLGDDSSSDYDEGDEDEDEENFDEDELEALEEDEDDDEAEEEGEDFEDFDEEDDFEGFDDDEDISELEEEEDPLAKLKALKEAKKAKESKDTKKENSKKDKTKKIDAPELATPDLFAKDDEDINYYAKKLGLKNGKKSKLTKTDDDDVIGGLLDGLDLDFGDESDDGSLSEVAEDDDSESENDDDDNSDLSDEDSEPHVRENPYVAPTEDADGEHEKKEEHTSKYIPPALRRKLALESGGVGPSEETIQLRKSIKGPLNRLSEANINTIVMEIDGLYLSHARHYVNEQLTNLIIESIVSQGRLLDTFVYLHAALVAAIYRLQGVEFGAYFIQTLLEKFEATAKDQTKINQKSKEASNLISLLSSIYLFSLVGSQLLYDIIKVLISDLNEVNAELLLRLIRSSGNQMRSDDPTALKEIVILVNQVSANLNKEQQLNPRTQFLIETITSLKNNKLKTNNEANHQLAIRLRKYLSSINNNKFNDPIQVSLDDIRNVETRGKWWLVGAAWKGIDSARPDPNDKETDLAVNDILDNAEPNWMELAKAQRMNTNIRRAIFVSIMSANDYVDAMTKLDKLALKRAQEREIPRVLIHCTGIEPAWNPYYGILAHKLCENHSNRKTFQFMLWDIIKEFEGGSNDGDSDEEGEDLFSFDEDIDDEGKLKRILNLGRFFGYLLSEGSLPLHILRTVNFVTASSNTVLFMEVLFVSFLDQIGKKSQVNSVGAGLSSKSKKMHEMKFDEKLLIERTIKAQEQPTLLRGIQFFLKDKVLNSDIITGRKQKKRVEWGVEAWTDIIEEFLRGKEDY